MTTDWKGRGAFKFVLLSSEKKKTNWISQAAIPHTILLQESMFEGRINAYFMEMHFCSLLSPCKFQLAVWLIIVGQFYHLNFLGANTKINLSSSLQLLFTEREKTATLKCVKSCHTPGVWDVTEVADDLPTNIYRKPTDIRSSFLRTSLVLSFSNMPRKYILEVFFVCFNSSRCAWSMLFAVYTWRDLIVGEISALPVEGNILQN